MGVLIYILYISTDILTGKIYSLYGVDAGCALVPCKGASPKAGGSETARRCSMMGVLLVSARTSSHSAASDATPTPDGC